MKRRVRTLFRPMNLVWLVILVAGVWALRFLPIEEIWATLKGLEPVELGIWLIFNFLIVIVICSRWWWILRLQGYPVAFHRLAAFRLIGFGISYFSPGTQFGGEPMQVYLAETNERVPRSEAIASVTLDKLIELLASFTFLAAGTMFVLNADVFGNQVSKTWTALLIAGLLSLPIIYLVLLWLNRRPFTWLAGRLPTFIKNRSLRGSIQPLAEAGEERIFFLLHHKPAGVIGIFLLSGVIILLFIAEYWLMLMILGVNPTWRDAITGLTVLRLSFLTPVPGGWGAMEAGQVMAFKWMGSTAAVGISASLLIRFRDVVVALFGLGLGSIISRRRLGERLHRQLGDIS